MECRVCGGLVEWRSVACDQTQCRRCGATDSQVEEEEQDGDGGPTEADLLGEVQHVADHDKWVDELASEIEWEPLRNFVLRLKADPGGEVHHGG